MSRATLDCMDEARLLQLLERMENDFTAKAAATARTGGMSGSGARRFISQGKAEAYEDCARRVRRVRLLVLPEADEDLAP